MEAEHIEEEIRKLRHDGLEIVEAESVLGKCLVLSSDVLMDIRQGINSDQIIFVERTLSKSIEDILGTTIKKYESNGLAEKARGDLDWYRNNGVLCIDGFYVSKSKLEIQAKNVSTY